MKAHWYLMRAAHIEKEHPALGDIAVEEKDVTVYVTQGAGGRMKFCISHGRLPDVTVGASVEWTNDTGLGYRRPHPTDRDQTVLNIVTITDGKVTAFENDAGLKGRYRTYVFK